MNRVVELLGQLVITALAVSLGVPIGWVTLQGFVHIFFSGVPSRGLRQHKAEPAR